MKRIVYLLLVCLLVGMLHSCSNKSKEKLLGIWKLKLMDVNGAKLQGSSLGNWLWEFNDEGGYLSDIAGAREKGRYELKNNILTLQPVTRKDKPAQAYTISRLDSVEMDLVLSETSNKTTLYFTRVQDSQLGEDKD